jgi:hypothetical protein
MPALRKLEDTTEAHFMCLSGCNSPHSTRRRLTGRLVSCTRIIFKFKRAQKYCEKIESVIYLKKNSETHLRHRFYNLAHNIK